MILSRRSIILSGIAAAVASGLPGFAYAAALAAFLAPEVS